MYIQVSTPPDELKPNIACMSVGHKLQPVGGDVKCCHWVRLKRCVRCNIKLGEIEFFYAVHEAQGCEVCGVSGKERRQKYLSQVKRTIPGAEIHEAYYVSLKEKEGNSK